MFYRILPMLLIVLAFGPGRSYGQCTATTLAEFYDCYGGTSAFTAQSVAAVTTFIQAEDAIQAGDFAQAQVLIQELFATYPKGDNSWWSVFDDPYGANLGTPHAYYGLRMMEDIVDFYLNGPTDVTARTARMKVVTVGCSAGVQPSTTEELNNGTGAFVEHELHPAVAADDYRIVHQSLDMLQRYVTAITGGQLELEIEFIELPEVCMDVNVNTSAPYVASGSIQPVWDALSDEVRRGTDWWWVIYPSHVPPAPVFDNLAFITGGMGADFQGGPVFIIDDLWLVRKPPHLGAGPYTDIERRIYLPQWLQHEIFHHFYRIYPELMLEVNGHDWFNLDFWPDDFAGRFEPDYYAETLHKRLQLQCDPLANRLITRNAPEDTQAAFAEMTAEELIGPYSRDEVQNDWHIGEILDLGGQYYWRNSANVQWTVAPDLSAGILNTGADCPYPGQHFFPRLYRAANGEYLPGITGLQFGGDFYRRRFGLLRDLLPVEAALGNYTRRPEVTTAHRGDIIKEAGQWYWENTAGERWSLTPDAENEHLTLGEDSPTPGERFHLILHEGECGLYVLGFRYGQDYYWRERRDPQNAPPVLNVPLSDLTLAQNFGTQLIDFNGTFTDPENDLLLHLAGSSDAAALNAQVSGEQLTLTGGAMGVFSIIVTAVDGNGGVATDEFIVTVGDPTAAEAVNMTVDNIYVFPNPVADRLYLRTPRADEYRLTLLTLDGTEVLTHAFSGISSDLSLQALPTGVYLLRCEQLSSGKRWTEKVYRVD